MFSGLPPAPTAHASCGQPQPCGRQHHFDPHNSAGTTPRAGAMSRPLGLFASPTAPNAPTAAATDALYHHDPPPPPPALPPQQQVHPAHVFCGGTSLDYAPVDVSARDTMRSASGQDGCRCEDCVSEHAYPHSATKCDGGETPTAETDTQSVGTVGTCSTGTGTYGMTNEGLSDRPSPAPAPLHTDRVAQATAFVHEAWALVDREWYPEYHVAAFANWLSVPGGLCFHNGDYHLFYQHHPFGIDWGPMHWGHAISKDLVHWQHLPIALAPGDAYDRDGCFSGSAVSYKGKLYLFYTGHTWFQGEGDSNIYQMQCLAVSEDGVHFEKRGPIARPPAKYRHCRDPKVWQREDGLWCMVLGARDVAKDLGQLLLYTTDDLTEWNDTEYMVVDRTTDRNAFMWECPDFFPYQPTPRASHLRSSNHRDAVDCTARVCRDGANGPLPPPCVNTYALLFCPQGVLTDKYRNRNCFQAGTLLGRFVPDPSGRGMSVAPWSTATVAGYASNSSRHSSYAAATPFRRGFEGDQPMRFNVTRQFREIDYGHDFYAPQSFVAPDGRRIVMAWMDMWASPMPSRDHGWCGCVTLPREIVITEHGDARLIPIRELEALRAAGIELKMQEIVENSELPLVEECTAYEVELTLNVERSTAEKYGLWLGSGAEIYVDAQAERLVVNRHYPEHMLSGNRSCPLPDATELHLRVFFDRSSMEVFVNDGETCFSTRIYPSANDRALRLFSINGTTSLVRGMVWQLASGVVQH